MTEAALAAGRETTLYVAVQDDLDRPFAEQLARFEEQGATIIRYAERNALPGTTPGRLSVADVTNIDRAADTYVCGPEAMIQFVRRYFSGQADKLHFEVFGPSLALEAPTAVS
ncbi:hypothetical protein [Exiguobacterium artemiae]